MTYCTDEDLLHYEPDLFKLAPFASQQLMNGSGDLAATAFTIAAGSFTTNHVETGHILTLAGTIDGSFPILSVDSAAQLTISVVHAALYPDSGSGIASGAGAAAGVPFTIRTFFAQRRIAADVLKNACGLDVPADTDPLPTVTNPAALRRAAVLLTLQLIYTALAAGAAEPDPLLVRAEMYGRQARRAIQRTRVDIDSDGDGIADLSRHLAVGRFTRD